MHSSDRGMPISPECLGDRPEYVDASPRVRQGVARGRYTASARRDAARARRCTPPIGECRSARSAAVTGQNMSMHRPEYVKVLREVDIRRAHVETQPEHVDALLTTWRSPTAPTRASGVMRSEE